MAFILSTVWVMIRLISASCIVRNSRNFCPTKGDALRIRLFNDTADAGMQRQAVGKRSHHLSACHRFTGTDAWHQFVRLAAGDKAHA